MTTTREPLSYPFEPCERLTLHPGYAHLRRSDPVVRVRLPYGEEAWLITRHEDVKRVFSDSRFSRAVAVERDEPRTYEQRWSNGMLDMDGAEHSRLRKPLQKAFAVRRVEALRPKVLEIANGHLDRIAATGQPADLVEELSLRLPVDVICELLGFPVEDRVHFHRWSQAILSESALAPEQTAAYWGEMQQYIREAAGSRRATPTDDLLGALVALCDEDHLTENELVTNVSLLLVGGHETTATAITNAVYVLLTNPDQLALLKSDRELIPRAVDELLRFSPVVKSFFVRYALENVELSGVLIRAGEPVVLGFGSANHDDEVFEDPDTLDISRQKNPHLTFGHGFHHCVGAQLARVEIQIALGCLLDRFPGLRLAVTAEELEWKTGPVVRGLKALPVCWEMPLGVKGS